MVAEELVRLSRVRRWAADGTARRIRVAAGVNSRDVAAPLGVSHATVHRWETGESVPRRDVALRWEALLSLLADQIGGVPHEAA